ncbi:alpha-L-fucosidase 2-like [Telopea speciosissima]|uniref:alpha-L-fucosidase 2-like n=1 Tax=Telopea speciosissima TaxID=54955 RepID=UPI001CC58B15|nr:alpha-L-fucosidase 2-like [Telopea speciosissima]
MEDDGEWVLVRRTTDIDLWRPNLNLEEMSNDDPLKVRFSEPAKHWTDACPIGNGRLGAMVWGGVPSESLQLNDDTLWTGVPGNYTNPDAPIALSQVRELVDKGQYPEATEAGFKLSDAPSDVYQPLGDIKLDFDDSHVAYDVETYQRELDLDTATVKVKYAVGDVEFTREHYVSFPHQVIATKISASKSGHLSFTVSLDSKLHHSSHVNGKNQIIMEGSCPGKRMAPKEQANDNLKGIQFSAVLDLQISDGVGVIQVVEDRKLKVEGSDWAILLVVASSSFDGPFTKPSESKKDPSLEALNTLTSIKNISYSELYVHHLDDYQQLFHRVSLQLSKSSKNLKGDQCNGMKKLWSSNTDFYARRIGNDTVSTAERVKSFKTDEDPSLVELLFQYGRYLLISSSRPGTQISNLQGIWNKDVEPAWDCAPHLNINLQMNYWPSLNCNLRECQEPLFDYISSLSINGSKTARINYETSGWVVHQVSDIWAKTSPDRGDPLWALWPMGGAWLCTHLWEHYTFTMDKAFLEDKAYPLLEGCASFLLDWLIEGRGGYLETNPSTSPEHRFIAPDGKLASVSYSSTMDMAIIREIFSAVISAAQVLGRSEDDLVERIQTAQPKLYPTKIARDGSIMEWAEDFQDPEVTHRHLSHLFGLFPGHTITIEKTPDLCKAADYTLYKRGEEGPGWSTTWKIALWARLHNSEHAYRMVKHLFDLVDPDHESNFEGGLYSNLFTAHPPFQIDANFGFTAAIAEMLVQSNEKDLYLLPALPRDKWASGCVKGLKARGGVTVSICWKEGELHEVGIWSKDLNPVKRLHYNRAVVAARILPGNVYTFNKGLKCVKMCPLSEAAVI